MVSGSKLLIIFFRKNFWYLFITTLIFFFIIQVMTPNPECATVETTILDALHIMHDGKFLHLPVLDKGELWSFLYSFRITIHSCWCAWKWLLCRWNCCCLCRCSADHSCCNFYGMYFMYFLCISKTLCISLICIVYIGNAW